MSWQVQIVRAWEGLRLHLLYSCSENMDSRGILLHLAQLRAVTNFVPDKAAVKQVSAAIRPRMRDALREELHITSIKSLNTGVA